MKILIAEDNLELQESVGMLMDHWGFDFDMACNGQEAVEKATVNEMAYDLCLMDVEMPVMNGLQATEIIRKNLKYFPIMAYSGNYHYRDECFEYGVDDFLEKPCSPSELLAKIQELTIKSYKCEFNGNELLLKKEMPVDQKHAQELQELKKQDLIKVKFDDIGGAEVVIHKNIINKIVQDFNIKKQFVSTFLNRNPDKPTKCILFGNNCRMPQVYLNDDDYNEELRAENEEAAKCSEMVLKVEKEE